MSYRVHIESFEGPFDLLLYLVSRQKVDIGSISITQIIDQYLDEISDLQKLDLDVASDFLLVAATLLKIKAESLLPHTKVVVDDEFASMTPGEAREILIQRLIEYKQYKNAAAALSARAESERRMHARPFGPDAEFLQAMPDFLNGVSLDQLGQLAARSLSRREKLLLESEHIAAKPIPVEKYIRSIHTRIVSEKRLMFSDLAPSTADAPIVVVNLLAILELFKRNMVTLRQDKAFGDIEIEYIEGSGELFLQDEDADAPVAECGSNQPADKE